MHKVLIAHSSEDVRTTLDNIISCKYRTIICADGFETAKLLKTERPDALILDLSLPGFSGIDVLREGQEHLPLAILATTWYPDPAMMKEATSLGVDHISVLPGKLGVLIYQLEDLLRQISSDTPATLKAHLRALSIPTHLDGYRQLLYVIPMKLEDPSRSLIKEIYSVIVKEMQLTSWQCVDRSIRSAIEKGWENGDRDIWLQYFPDATQRPSVSQFIAELMRRLSENN